MSKAELGAAVGVAAWLDESQNVHDSTKTYKQGARVQNGFGGAWYEAVQDVTAGQALTNNPTFWLPSSNFKIFNSDDVLTTGRDLTANDINKHLIFNNALPQTFTLPLVSSIPSGSVIYVRGGQSIATFNCSGSDAINVNNSGTVPSCSCFGSEAVMLVSNGGGDWRLTNISPIKKIPNETPIDTTTTYLFGPTYTNTTGRAFVFSASAGQSSSGNVSLFVNGAIADYATTNASAWTIRLSAIVPNGATFRFTGSASTGYNSSIQYLE